jgi:RNA polymerase sigma-70 factor, ECF subfamily
MSQVLTKPTLLTDPLHIIIKGCIANDMQCQEQLYRHCYPEMIRTCFRYAGDMDGAGTIFNNAMLRVFRHIHKYSDQGKLMGWIKTIVINCCIDFVKQQNRFREHSASDLQEYEMNIPPEVFHRVSAKEIQHIIKQLPKATATVFNLYVYDGFTHKQISQALKIAEGTSKWHVNEARKWLKTNLEDFFNPQAKKDATR